jgi:PilZ domain
MRPKATRRTFAFEARAEVTLANSDPASGRVREISVYGCFLEFPISLSQGTPAFVKMFTESETFEADGTVIYSQPDVGFGFAFRDLKPHFPGRTPEVAPGGERGVRMPRELAKDFTCRFFRSPSAVETRARLPLGLVSTGLIVLLNKFQ